MFNAFVPTCEIYFDTKNGKKKTLTCDIEGFVPAASLNGLVGFLSSFVKSLIGSSRKYDMMYTLS